MSTIEWRAGAKPKIPSQPLSSSSTSRPYSISIGDTLRRLGVPALALTGLWVGLLFLMIWHWTGYHLSPLTAGWRQWDRANHWNMPGVMPHGPLPPQVPPTVLLTMGLIFVAATAAHFWAVLNARRLRHAGQGTLWFILGATVVMGGVVLLLPNLFSDDVFSYILYGRIGALYHANPMLVTPAHFPHDPFLRYVYWRTTPSVYGATWLWPAEVLTHVAQRLGGSLPVYIALYKVMGLVCHLANAALIWGILVRIAPQRRVLGTVLYAWNPLAVIEFAGSGHNDALMLTYLLIGIWLAVRQFEMLAAVAWAAAITTKFILLILVPLWLWHVVLTRWRAAETHDLRLALRCAWEAGWRGGVLAVAVVAFMAPFWGGPHLITVLLHSPPTQRIDNSLLDLLVRFIPWPLSALLHKSRFILRKEYLPLFKDTGIVAFALAWLWALFQRVPRDLLAACAWALASYIVLASAWFWPWYVTWPLAFVALRPLGRQSLSVLLLAGGVLSIYAFLPDRASLAFGLRALFAFGPAIAYVGLARSAQVRHAVRRAGTGLFQAWHAGFTSPATQKTQGVRTPAPLA